MKLLMCLTKVQGIRATKLYVKKLMKHEEPNGRLFEQTSAMSSNRAMTTMLFNQLFKIIAGRWSSSAHFSSFQFSSAQLLVGMKLAYKELFGSIDPADDGNYAVQYAAINGHVKYLLELMVSQRDLVAGTDVVAHVDSAAQLAAEGN